MTNVRLTQILFTFFIFFLSPACAQKIKYTIHHYTSDDGLPQNSIKSITADSEGFIWMGTEDGLVRYDGNRFYTFNAASLQINNTRSIFMQPALRQHPKAKRAQQGSNAITYVFFMGSPSVKIEKGTAILDTAYYNRDYKQLAPFKKETPYLFQSTGLPNFLMRMTPLRHYLIRSGNTDNDFFICDSSHITSYKNWKPKYSQEFRTDNLWNYFVIGADLCYFHEKAAAITIFSLKTKTTLPLSGDILKNPAFKTHKKNIRIYWNNVSDQVYLYLKKSLYILRIPDGKHVAGQRTNSVLPSTTLLVEDFDLVSTGIEEIYYDQLNKQVFLGSGTEGLYVLSQQQFQTINVKGDFRDNVFYAQVPNDQNTVLTADGRIVGKDFTTRTTLDRFEPLIRRLNGDDKFSMIKTKNGDIWTKQGSVLFHFNKTRDKVLGEWHFKYNVDAMHQDPSGRIWFESNDEGLFYIDAKDKNDKPVLLIKNPQLRITTIKSGRTGHLLVGTQTGLYDVDIHLKKEFVVAGTAGLHIKSIYTDTQNNNWITTLKKGILLLTPEGSLITFPLDKNEYLASPHCIVSDQVGYFWIPTNTGLFQIASEDLLRYATLSLPQNPNAIKQPLPSGLFYNFHTKNEGFNTNEFNGSCDPCGVRLQNGYISLPSLNGLVWFNPEKFTTNEPNGNIILDKAEVNQRLLNTSHDTLYFPLNPHRIRLQFATVYSGNKYNLTMSYVLVKKNETVLPSDWITIQNDNFIVEFSSLNSGNYTLLVKKLNGFGINNYTVKKIFFVVPLFWYETWWAIVLMIAALLFIIYSFIVLRLKKITLANERLEEIITQRTDSLKVTLEELEQSKNQMGGQLQLMSTLLASISHDIQSPLYYIFHASEEIGPLVKKGDLDNILKIGILISDVSRRTGNMLLDLLNYLKVNVYGKRMSFEMINLSELIDEKLAIFKTTIASKRSHYINEIPAQVQVRSDLQMLSIIIHNLLDNAAKYTYNGEIRIYTQTNDQGNIELIISNSEKGLSPQIIELLNNKTIEKNEEQPLRRAQTTGLGLLIVKEVADILGISIRVTQTDQTVFYLEFYG
ncbi:sensor histidine kinase [Dyadobacter frigoris]|nr:HAMP domain-containing sensor histidine kinase [Dyadobacter frigoris]